MKLKTINETIMDNAFDFFNKKMDFITRDGYYEIKNSLEKFVDELSKAGWIINKQGNENYPANKYVEMTNKNYPTQTIGILKVSDNSIHVGESDQFN